MTVSISFRTNDGSRWVTGIGRNLTPTEVDLNMWALKVAVDTLQTDLPDAAVGIDDFTVSGDQLTVVMTDATTRGPFTLPVVSWNFLGDWEASTAYVVGDVVSATGGVYLVLYAHTSDVAFDPGENDGSGNDYYGLLFEVPLPTAATLQRITTTTLDLDTSHIGKMLMATNVAGLTVTVPSSGTSLIPVYSEIHFRQAQGCPSITFVEGGSGIAINGVTDHSLGTDVEGAVCTLKQTDVEDDWILFGNLASGSF